MPRIALITTVVLILTLALAPTALAARSGGQGRTPVTTSFSLVLANSTDGLPHYGQTVRFNVSTSATTQPLVKLYCYQNGVWVYWASTGYYDGYPWPWTQNFILASTYWTRGAADCTATLYYHSNRKFLTLSTLNFRVYE